MTTIVEAFVVVVVCFVLDNAWGEWVVSIQRLIVIMINNNVGLLYIVVFIPLYIIFSHLRTYEFIMLYTSREDIVRMFNGY